jgi:hypothetical protein
MDEKLKKHTTALRTTNELGESLLLCDMLSRRVAGQVVVDLGPDVRQQSFPSIDIADKRGFRAASSSSDRQHPYSQPEPLNSRAELTNTWLALADRLTNPLPSSSFRVSFRFVSFRFVSFRFVFVSMTSIVCGPSHQPARSSALKSILFSFSWRPSVSVQLESR